MTPANEQGQNGTNGSTNTSGFGSTTGGMEPATPAMGMSSSTADPLAGGIDDTQTRTGPDASQSSAYTQGSGMPASGATGADGERISKVKEQATKLRSQATDRVRSAAVEGKTRATDTLDGVARAVHEAAGNLEAQVNPQVAQYVHRAADALDNFSASLRNKSIDEIVEDATDYARRSPAVAIGAAVALGFALSRFLKATSSESTARTSYAYDDDDDLPAITTTGTTGSQPRYNA